MNNYLKKYIRMLLKENNDNFFEMLLTENIEKALEKMGLTSLTLDFLNSKDLGKRQIAIANYIANEIKKGGWDSNQSEEEQALEVINQYLDELIFMHKELNSVGIMIDLRKFKLIEDAYSYIEKEYEDKFGETKPGDSSQEIIMKFPDGFYWILLNKKSCEEEGREMQHCGRGIGTNLISLRNRMGGRHVTVDIDENTQKIMQIKGKNNTKPVEKYFPYIVSLLKSENYSDYEFGRNMMFSKIDFNLIDLYNYDKKDPEIREKIINLAENGDEYVRESLAKNPNLDKEFQLILVEKGSDFVRKALAWNKNTDREIQLILAERGNYEVREALAYNPNLDKEIKLILAEKGSDYVRGILARNRNIDKELQLILAKKGGNRARIYLAENPNIDKEIQLILAEKGSYEVRWTLALNPNLAKDKEVQLILFEKGSDEVRYSLAENPNIDREVQLILAKKGNDRVRRILLNNPNLDPEIKRMLETR